MRGEKLSEKQIEKGIIILAVFVVLRAIIGRVDQSVQVSSQSLLFLTSAFLILSIGLVYLGFTKWVGIDLKQWWWFDRKRILGDVGWGTLGFFNAMVSAVVVVAPIIKLGLVPASVLQNPSSQRSPIEFLLMLFFGLAIAGFQEETIFRGFLQRVLIERFGIWPGNILQAAAFSIAHVGYYPLTAWPLFILAFVLGIVFGLLNIMRGTLIVPWIAHGLIG